MSKFIWVDNTDNLHRTVDGRYIEDKEEARGSWSDLAIALQKRFQLKVESFDPGFDCVDEKSENAVFIPTWLALRMVGEKGG